MREAEHTHASSYAGYSSNPTVWVRNSKWLEWDKGKGKIKQHTTCRGHNHLDHQIISSPFMWWGATSVDFNSMNIYSSIRTNDHMSSMEEPAIPLSLFCNFYNSMLLALVMYALHKGTVKAGCMHKGTVKAGWEEVAAEAINTCHDTLVLAIDISQHAAIATTWIGLFFCFFFN